MPQGINFADYCGMSVEMYNYIISGGTVDERTSAIYALLYKACALNLPTIILHSGNAYLQKEPLAHICSKQVFQYEPTGDKNSTEIADLLTEVAINALGENRKIFSLIHLIISILETSGEKISLCSVVNFPCDKVMEKLEELHKAEKITDSQRKDFAKRYSGAASDSECVAGASRLFSRLKNSWREPKELQLREGLQETINASGILTFDLVADTNEVLKELCFTDVNMLMQRGEHFLLIVDGLSALSKEDSHTNAVLMRNSGNISLLYSAADVPQMMLQREEFFNTLTGGHANLILFKHNNGHSAQRWASFFGQEWTTIIERTTGRSSQDWNLFGGGSNTSEQERKQRVDKYPQEVFMNIPLGQGKGFLVDFTGNIPQQVIKVKMPKLTEEVLLCLR